MIRLRRRKETKKGETNPVIPCQWSKQVKIFNVSEFGRLSCINIKQMNVTTQIVILWKQPKNELLDMNFLGKRDKELNSRQYSVVLIFGVVTIISLCSIVMAICYLFSNRNGKCTLKSRLKTDKTCFVNQFLELAKEQRAVCTEKDVSVEQTINRTDFGESCDDLNKC